MQFSKKKSKYVCKKYGHDVQSFCVVMTNHVTSQKLPVFRILFESFLWHNSDRLVGDSTLTNSCITLLKSLLRWNRVNNSAKSLLSAQDTIR